MVSGLCCSVCLLIMAAMLVTSVQEAEANLGLLPSWMPGGPRHSQPATTTRTGNNCATYLDVNKHGSPDCPLDQQFFDTHTCQFVCDPVPAASHQNGVRNTRAEAEIVWP